MGRWDSCSRAVPLAIGAVRVRRVCSDLRRLGRRGMSTFRLHATCRHCPPPGLTTAYSCPFKEGPEGVAAGTWCLRAWGWYRSPGGNNNWSCPKCAHEGEYKAPKPSRADMSCECLRRADGNDPIAQLQVAQAQAQAQARA